MHTLKRILIGFPKTELKEYAALFGRLKQNSIPQEDMDKVVNRCMRNSIWKVISLPSAIGIGFLIPPFPGFTYPVIMHMGMALMSYRILTVEYNYKTYMMVKEMCEKYNLKTNLRLLRMDMKDPFDLKVQKDEIIKTMNKTRSPEFDFSKLNKKNNKKN